MTRITDKMGIYCKGILRKAGGNHIIWILLMTLSIGNIGAQSLHTTYADLPCVNKTFHAMVYVVAEPSGQVGITVENIQAVFEEANRVFAPICLTFKIAKIDTIPNYSYNVIMAPPLTIEAVNLFSLDNRLNVYFVAGLFSFPTAGHTVGSILSTAPNGLFVRKARSTSFIHQLGIFFGLLPTNHDPGSELVNGSNCEEAGDQICDTPADPFSLAGVDETDFYVENCEFIFRTRDPNGDFYQPDVGNAMSYYGCPCTGFTRGQFLKMVENYNNAAINLW